MSFLTEFHPQFWSMKVPWLCEGFINQKYKSKLHTTLCRTGIFLRIIIQFGCKFAKKVFACTFSSFSNLDIIPSIYNFLDFVSTNAIVQFLAGCFFAMKFLCNEFFVLNEATFPKQHAHSGKILVEFVPLSQHSLKRKGRR